MDDLNATRQALEALADLYLNPVTGPARPRTQSRPGERPVGPSASAPSQLSLAGQQPAGGARPPRPANPFLLHGAPAPSGGQSSKVARPKVIGLIVGNVPPFAGPWVSQHVSDLARTMGDAALLTIDEQRIEIELFPAPNTSPSPAGQQAHQLEDWKLTQSEIRQLLEDEDVEPSQAGPLEDEDDSGEMARRLDELAGRVKVWLLRLPVERAWQAGRLAGLVDGWTVLSGCDSAAIVGAYRIIKTLADASALAAAQAGGIGGGGGPEHEGAADGAVRIELSFVGCEPDQAREAMSRLGRTASTYLHAQVEQGPCHRRITPAAKRFAGCFEGRTRPMEQLVEFLFDLRQRMAEEPIFTGAAGAAAESMDEIDGPIAFPGSSMEGTGSLDGGKPAVEHAPELAVEPSIPGGAEDWLNHRRPVRNPSAPAQAPAASPASTASLNNEQEQLTPEARPNAEAASAQAAEAAPALEVVWQGVGESTRGSVDGCEAGDRSGDPAGKPALARLLGGQMVGLQAEYPADDRVKLAVDGGGRLQVMLHAEPEGDGAPLIVGRSVVTLFEAAAWAMAHAKLLALTVPQVKLAMDQPPALHLFLADPRPATGLIAAGASGCGPVAIKVHLLKAVEIAGHRGWTHAQISG